MTRDVNMDAASSTGRGDRIVQIILLALIAAGLVGIPLVLRGGGSEGTEAAGPGGSGGGFPGAQPAGAEQKAAAVGITPAVLGSVREFVKVNGDVEAQSSVNIYPDTSGKLVSVEVSPGDVVRHGQTVAVVDPSLPGQVYGMSAVTATIGGTITAVNADVGETVGTSTAVITIGDLSALEVVTYVPERYVGSVSLGMEAEVVLDAYPDEVFRARVTEISPVLDITSRSQKISLAIRGADPRVKAGMFASTRIVVRQTVDAVVVPPEAVTAHYDREVVYVVADGVAERRDVIVGLSSADAVEIIGGLAVGETVVVRGLSGITDSSRVRVVE